MNPLMTDVPPLRDHSATFITQFVIIGDAKIAYNGKFLRQNRVTHIVNLCTQHIINIYDEFEYLHNPEAKQIINEKDGKDGAGLKTVGSI